MKIICAPDKFKECLTAPQAAEAMAKGIRRVLPDAVIDLCPIADGGEGTVAALLAATGGQAMSTRVQDPLGSMVYASWGMLGQRPGQHATAIIEMAAASGLALIEPQKRDPTLTSTFGTGQLIKAALDHGARHIIIGIGGSATTDAGCGCAQALGARFFDKHDQPIDQPIAGGKLQDITRIDLTHLHPALKDAAITVACDVTNPLTGQAGAAYVYGPQKGATPTQVQQLDQGLAHIANLWRKQLGSDVEQSPGSGAAGGLGGGLMAMLDATLKTGIRIVLDAVDFSSRAKGADLCLTGEGRIDGQSLSGKACLGVAKAATAAGVPATIALVGSADDDADKTLEAGLSAYHVIGKGLPKEESMRRAGELLEQAAARVVSEMKAGR